MQTIALTTTSSSITTSVLMLRIGQKSRPTYLKLVDFIYIHSNHMELAVVTLTKQLQGVLLQMLCFLYLNMPTPTRTEHDCSWISNDAA